MKNLSNTEVELKKRAAYKNSVYSVLAIVNSVSQYEFLWCKISITADIVSLS